MAMRTLDAAFWDDGDVARLTRDERLLLICMITDPSLSDDYGVLPANAKTLRKHAFGYDDEVRTEDVQRWRDGILAKCRNVKLFDVEGQEWICLKNFGKFQELRYKRKTNYPSFQEVSENSGNLPENYNKFPMSSVVLSSVVLSSDDPAASAADDPPSPPRNKSKPEIEGVHEMQTAIVELCKIPTTAVKGVFVNAATAARALLKAGFTLNDLAVFREKWYAYDWRGVKDQPPTISQLRNEWQTIISLTGKASNNGRDKRSIVPDTSRVSEFYRKLAEDTQREAEARARCGPAPPAG